MAYLLDANVFIEAKKLHYGFDFCPAFWDWLIAQQTAARVFSIEKVHDEIRAGADDLTDWADARGAGFFLAPDDTTIPALGAVSTWANGQNYKPAAVSTFLQLADYYIVAQALAGKHVVVTHEKAGAAINRIKIPNACIALKVKCMTPFEMLRLERARFVLGPAK